MENTNELNNTIAKNLTHYRKEAGLTQAELAEKINYSDKSVSKWESGNGVPDVYTLVQIAELFGVTLNDLVGEEGQEKPVAQTENMPKQRGLHVLIMLLSSGIVWLVATCVFVALQLLSPGQAWWMSFIFAIPVNAIVMIVYAGVWKYRLVNFFSVSTLIWTVLVSAYLTARFICLHNGWDYEGWWTLFLLGVPLQVLEALWVFFRSTLTKYRNKLRDRVKEDEEKKKQLKQERSLKKAAKTSAKMENVESVESVESDVAQETNSSQTTENE